MDLVVGCPVSDRKWILDRWRQHVDVACANAGLVPTYLFTMSRSDECVDLAASWGATIAFTNEEPRKDVRDWENSVRYNQMVDVRNRQLSFVRAMSPRLYLSLDSDILLHPVAIVGMLEVLGAHNATAVGGKTFMTTRGENVPSYSDAYSMKRRACVDVRKVSVIMAIKLMTSEAYNVDYEFHPNGEDIGWSKAVARSGGQLAWDGRIANKHVMNRSMLETIDERVGF